MIEERYKKLKKIHAAIRGAVELFGFSYRHAEKWFNIELGIAPSGNLNHAFAIRIDSLDDSENSEDLGRASVVVEFSLDAKQDNYLDRIDQTVEAVNAAVAALRAEKDVGGVNAHSARFKMAYVGELVVVTFSPIEIEYPFK
jgi:hypothetical protein